MNSEQIKTNNNDNDYYYNHNNIYNIDDAFYSLIMYVFVVSIGLVTIPLDSTVTTKRTWL